MGGIIFLGQPTVISTKLRMICVQLSTPFVRLGNYIPTVKSRRDLDAQVRELKAENDILRQQVRGFRQTVIENANLNRLLDFKQHLHNRTIGARVIGRDASNWWKSLQIDRGSNDGLRENMPVLNADGLIGKVERVTRGEARVLLLCDPSCKASAMVQPSGYTGVVAGEETAFGSSPNLLMTFVKREAKFQAGENVITSGLGNIFPKGIQIGTVVQAQLNPQTGMYQDLVIKPAVDYWRLEEVIIILE